MILKSIECETAEVFYRNALTEIVRKGFCSSDCKCATHLFYIKNKEKTEKILKKISFSICYSFSNLFA